MPPAAMPPAFPAVRLVTTTGTVATPTVGSRFAIGVEECLGDLAGQTCELRALGVVEHIEGVAFVRTRACGLLGSAPPLGGQADECGAAVVLIALS
jgi:hypothetical protein